MRNFFLLTSFLLISNLALAQSKNFLDRPFLETTAQVDTLIKPDLIYLDILLNEKDGRNKISVEELELKMVEQLKNIGIDISKQLILSDLASNFKKYFLKQKEVVKSKAYELKLFDSKTAGKTIVALENVGISNVDLNRTEYPKLEQLKLELKYKAVQKAKKQANFLIKPLNQKVKRALYITDRYLKNENYQNDDLEEIVVIGYGIKRKNSVESPAIEFKSIKISSEVTVKFEIE